MKKQLAVILSVLFFISFSGVFAQAAAKTKYNAVSFSTAKGVETFHFKLPNYNKQYKLYKYESPRRFIIAIANSNISNIKNKTKQDQILNVLKKSSLVKSLKLYSSGKNTIRIRFQLKAKHTYKITNNKNNIKVVITKATPLPKVTPTPKATAKPVITPTPKITAKATTDPNSTPTPNVDNSAVLQKSDETLKLTLPNSSKAKTEFLRKGVSKGIYTTQITATSMSGAVSKVVKYIKEDNIVDVKITSSTSTKTVLSITSKSDYIFGSLLENKSLNICFMGTFMKNSTYTSDFKKATLLFSNIKFTSGKPEITNKIAANRKSIAITGTPDAIGIPNGTYNFKDCVISKMSVATSNNKTTLTLATNAAMYFHVRAVSAGKNVYFEIYTTEGLKDKLICLDPGHGGSDSGAVGKQGNTKIYESKLNMNTVNKINNILAGKGVPTILTRSKDVFVSLDDRVKIANNAKCALFLSVHYNSFTSSTANGTETYYYNRSSTGTVTGKQFATAINNAIVGPLGTFNRGVKTAAFVVIKNTTMPAVLAEVGFVTNAKDVKLFMQDEKQNAIAAKISDALIELLFD